MAEPASRLFVGRVDELARLVDAFRRACEDRSSVVVVRGEAGVGKSTLVDHFVSSEVAEVFGRSPFVVVGHCVAPELVFVPIVEALRSLVSVLGARFDEIVGVARAEVAALVPDLLPGHPPAGGGGTDERLFDALCQVLTRAAGIAPLIVVIEDIQWADRATLDVLRYATLTLGEARVLVVLTVRDEEVRPHADALLQSWLGELGRVRHVAMISLAPFTEAEASQLVEALALTSSIAGSAESLYARSGGNPFMLTALMVAADRGVPPLVRDALAARRAALADDAIALVRVAAAIGPTVPHRLVAEVAGLGQSALTAALWSLIDEGILVADEAGRPRYRFRHALWQEAVLEDVLAVERQELHRRVAAALASDPGLIEGGPQVVAPLLAAQWQASGDPAETFASAVTAGRVLSAMGLAMEGLELFARALRLWPTVADARTRAGTDHAGLLEEAASAAYAAGQAHEAVEYLRAASALVDPLAEPVRRAALAADLGYYLIEAGEPHEGVALLDAVIAGDLDGTDAAVGWALARRAQHGLRTSHFADAPVAAQRAVEIATTSGDDLLLAHALTTLGALTEDVAVLDRALEVARRLGSNEVVLRLLHNKLLALVLAEDSYRAAAGVLRELIDALAHPMPMAAKAGLATAALVSCYLGDFAAVDALLARVPDIEPAGRNGFMTLGELFTIRWCRGELEDASVLLEQLRAVANTVSEPDMFVDIAINAAQLACAQNDPRRALRDLEVALAPIGTIDDAWARSGYLVWAARVSAGSAASGRAAPAQIADARAVWERVRAAVPEEPVLPAYTEAIAAEVAVLAGEPDPARFAAAANAFEEMADVVEAGWCRVREVDSALAVGDRRRARTVANDAYHAASNVGYGLVTRLLADRAARAGFTLVDTGAQRAWADTGLTAREQDVLAALAEGLSNREIAARLFLGVRTVETHVSRLLAKLGAADRTDAVARARQLGLIPAPS